METKGATTNLKKSIVTIQDTCKVFLIKNVLKSLFQY